ncbi:MAG TPA: hypothetical protein VF741_00445 [Candidatus Aquilonibacter sp.]
MMEERRYVRRWAAGAFAAIVSLAMATAAFAGGAGQPRPVTILTPPQVRPVQPQPSGSASAALSPLTAIQHCPHINMKSVKAGAKVPIACFGILPRKTTSNTATLHATAKGRHFRPMAATGATVDLTSGANCGSQGAIYQIGCSLSWVGTNLADWSTTDTYQSYYVPPNATTATAAGGTFAYNAAPTETTTLSTGGTYSFFIYDTTKQVIVAIVYADAGQGFQIGVYSDPYHEVPSYQFSTVGSSAAYIYLPNVSTNDTYVVYVMSTSVNAYCVYVSPAATPSPGPASPMPTGSPNSLLCNPANSPGINAPGGSLSLEWPFSTSLQPGTYSIVVYDKTANEELGQVQVSLTGVNEYAFVLYPTPAAAASAQPTATPPGTVFAWDSTSEQSDGGIVATLPNQLSGTYRMTFSDPDGQVVSIPAVSPNPIPATCTAGSNTSALCTETGTFQFSAASPAIHSPGQYPNNIYTVQLINTANNTVESSQAFELVGYNMETEFDNGGTYETTVNFADSTGVASLTNVGLYFLNNGPFAYPNDYDTIKGIEYTSGVASSLTGAFTGTSLSNTTGNGVTFTLPSCTGSYQSAGGCTQTVTDSSGNSWTAAEWCSTTTPTTPTANSQCVLKVTPLTSGAVLAGNGSITITGMNWYAYNTSGGNCSATPCVAITSILPNDGLSWSSTSTTSPAWAPTYYGTTNAAIIGTATAHYIGSATFTGNTSRNAVAFATSPPTTPWTNTHFYQSNFTQGDYQNDSPFGIAAGREDILVINLTDCLGAGTPAPSCSGASSHNLDEIAITFPSNIPASEITVDPSEPNIPGEGDAYELATTGNNACKGTLPSNAICLNPGGNNGNVGVQYGAGAADAQGQIWLDVPQGEASYVAQNLQIQSWNNTETTWTSLTADGHTSAATTPVVGGGLAGTALGSLSLQAFSLNSNYMAAQFDPSTVSPGTSTTSYSLTFTNTSTAADPNPDPVDAIVIEQLTSTGWTVNGTPTFSGTGSSQWSNLSGTGYSPATNELEYWFGLCAGQYVTGGGPPQTPPNPTNPAAQQTALGACTAAQEQDAIAAGGSLTINFTLNDTATGTQTFYVYAHGANGGGWSAPKTVTISSAAKSATEKFFSVAAGSADSSCSKTSNVSTNTVANVSAATNCYIYEVTNTSGTGNNISTVNIALPAYDINGVATSGSAWDLFGVPVTTNIVLGTISGGTFTTSGIPAGCAINTATSATYNPVQGATAGQIQVSGCTGFAPGDNIAVEYVASTPQSENDSYLFPTTVDGISSGVAWSGSNEITVSFTLGLSIAVDPSNPGPGGSTPTVTCTPAQCTFSGATVDFGDVPSVGAGVASVTGTDLVRATVIYGGNTVGATCPANAGTVANTWQLEVQATANQTNELETEEDETDSRIGSGTWGSGVGSAFFPIASTATVLACGNYTNGTDYDVLQNFGIYNAADTSGHLVTVTYTLIGN